MATKMKVHVKSQEQGVDNEGREVGASFTRQSKEVLVVEDELEAKYRFGISRILLTVAFDDMGEEFDELFDELFPE